MLEITTNSENKIGTGKKIPVGILTGTNISNSEATISIENKSLRHKANNSFGMSTDASLWQLPPDAGIIRQKYG